MNNNKSNPTILHLSYDLRVKKKEIVTSAVKDLIEESKHFSTPHIISLLRVPSLREMGTKQTSPNVLEVNVFGFPFGILLGPHLNLAHKLICKSMPEFTISNMPIDLIHAHKLTFEGYIGYKIAKKHNIPLIVTIRQTDFDVLKYKKLYHSIYRKVIEYSSAIIYLVPYMVKKFQEFWEDDFFEKNIRKKLVFLPNIIDRDVHAPSLSFNQKELLTISHMVKKPVKRKNLKRLFRALKSINDKSIKLKVIGGGHYLEKVKQWVEELELIGQVEFYGKIDNKLLDTHFQKAHAFVLPSKSESFGMVYAEALMNGTPILYSRDTGFDGFFEDVGEVVNPYDVDSIKNGILQIIANNDKYRKKILELQKKRAFDIFLPHKVREKYRTIVRSVILSKKN